MNIKLVVFDFDGVFTDGTVNIDNQGITTKKYNVKDGMGIYLLRKNNIQVGVISGYQENDSQYEILKRLKIDHVALNIKDKLSKLKEWCEELNIDLKTEVAYMGDDLNDLMVIKEVNLSGCPSDAVDEIKEIAKFKSTKKGGQGCVREFCDLILNQLDNKLGYFDTYTNTNITSNNTPKKSNIEKNLDQNVNVLILAADINNNSYHYFSDHVTILEYNIRLLILCGINKNNIYVALNKPNCEIINKIGCNIIFNTKLAHSDVSFRSGYTLKTALFQLKNIDKKIIILRGNIHMDMKQLDILLKTNNCVLTNTLINYNELKGLFINSKNNIITHITSNKSLLRYPFKLFSGLLTLDYRCIQYILNTNIDNEYLLTDIELIYFCLSKHKINLFEKDYDTNTIDSFDLIGGSYAGLNKMLIVKKYAYGDGKNKLKNEIIWLNNLNNELKKNFPEVINYNITDKECFFFDMEYYPYPSLRKMILLNMISNDEIFKIITKILNFVFNKLYVNIIGSTPDDWILKNHILRVEDRLNFINRNNDVLKNFIDKEYIVLNGKKYKNINYFINLIKNNKSFLELIKPDQMRLIHGDLHFQNILIKSVELQDFILLDPRGELNGSDFYYDMGKLFHSFNGLYDLIHIDYYNISYKFSKEYPEINLKLGDTSILDKYNDIKIWTMDKLSEYPLISNDKNWKIKCKFAELMNFSSLFVFHVKNDNIENRAIALYATSIKLIDEFLNDYEHLF